MTYSKLDSFADCIILCYMCNVYLSACLYTWKGLESVDCVTLALAMGLLIMGISLILPYVR